MKLLSTNLSNVHFTEEQWADFVRGVADEALHVAMQAHLDSGCLACRASFQWLDDFARAAEKEPDVPQALIQQAREIFATPPPRLHWTEAWETLSSQLIRQVGLGWQPAGVRASSSASASTGGRMLFRAGHYVVDLQVEPPCAGSVGEIVGQITNEHERESLEGIVVELMTPGRVVSETATNRFGEFVIECDQTRNVTLRLAIAHRMQRIDLPLGLRV